jgi:hypothetical protein
MGVHATCVIIKNKNHSINEIMYIMNAVDTHKTTHAYCTAASYTLYLLLCLPPTHLNFFFFIKCILFFCHINTILCHSSNGFDKKKKNK